MGVVGADSYSTGIIRTIGSGAVVKKVFENVTFSQHSKEAKKNSKLYQRPPYRLPAGPRCYCAMLYMFSTISLLLIFRSYHREYSNTHQNIELKHGWAGLVLG